MYVHCESAAGGCALENYMLDIFPVLALFVLLYGFSWQKRGEPLRSDYLSMETTRVLKGIFALLILIHHLAFNVTGSTPLWLLHNVGFIAVSVFFFISGYGMTKQFLQNPTYKQGFLKKRFAAVLIPYLMYTLLYWVYAALFGTIYSPLRVLGAIAAGSPIVANSWYIICILVFYPVFYLLMALGKKHKALMVFGALAFWVVYELVCYNLGFGPWWFNSFHIIILGMVWALYEKQILAYVKPRYSVLMIGMVVLFAEVWYFRDAYINAVKGENPFPYFKLVIAVVFTVAVILLQLKFRFGNRILRFFGDYCLDVYLCQGMVLSFFRTGIFTIWNDALYFLVCILVTSALAVLMNKANKRVMAWYKECFLEKK